MDGFPSGQREQTVNLPSQTSMVRIHPHPPLVPPSAGMAELADAQDSGSCEGFLHAGSSPVSRTKQGSGQRWPLPCFYGKIRRFSASGVCCRTGVVFLCQRFYKKCDTKCDIKTALSFYDTPSGRGRPSLWRVTRKLAEYFNPRPREEGDSSRFRSAV